MNAHSLLRMLTLATRQLSLGHRGLDARDRPSRRVTFGGTSQAEVTAAGVSSRVGSDRSPRNSIHAPLMHG